MRKMLIFLCVFLLRIDFNLGVWRYNNNMNDEQLFTIADSISLEYRGSADDFIEWEYPDTCSIDAKSSVKATLKCTSPGYQRVKPLVISEEQETRFLYIKDSFFSFAWYAIMLPNRSSTDTFLQEVRMWIIDPDQADTIENEGTALRPSTKSQYLTKHFYNLGQFPLIKLKSEETVMGHFMKDGYWQASIPGDRKYYNFHIYAQPINFQHRFIINSQHTFYWIEKERPFSGHEVPLRLPQGSSMSVVYDTCKSYRSLLLTDLGLYITQDSFNSYQELKVEPGVLPEPPEGYFTVDNCALLEDGILLLINGTLYWRDDLQRTLTLQPSLPYNNLKGMFQRIGCAKAYPNQGLELGTVLVWEDHRLFMGSSLFQEGQPGYLQRMLVLPPSATILTASFGSTPLLLACLVMYTFPDAPPRPSLLTCNLQTRVWRTSTFLTKFKDGDLPQGPFNIRFIDSAMDALLLWNKETVIYSFRNDNDWGVLQPPNATNLKEAAGGSQIDHVFLDHNWNMLVKMTDNLMFYCKVGMHEVVPLPNWRKQNTRMFIYLNEKDQFLIITQSLSGKVEDFRYPLTMETKSAMYGTHHGCPFITFEHSMTAAAYHLDKGDSLTFWAKVVYPEGKGVHVMLLNNRNNLLIISQNSHYEIVHKVDTVNMTIQINQQMDYSDAKSYADLIKQTSGVLTLELVPNLIGNTCTLPMNRISHFNIGCPPTRHIRVARPWGMPCEMNTLTNYTIPRYVLWNPPETDLEVEYDWETFGCLLKLHFETAFHPHLDLYDGNTFVKTVDANFIVWENFGRNDYSFNATMQQMGCLREAQTWNTMLSENQSLERAWGPENYQSCFKVMSGKLGNLDQPYEILNRSSSNFITFSQVDSAIYVFHVKILDPNFSFCDLSAVFAVQTYGISIPRYDHLTVYVPLIFSVCVLCMLGYSYCRYIAIFRKHLAASRLKHE